MPGHRAARFSSRVTDCRAMYGTQLCKLIPLYLVLPVRIRYTCRTAAGNRANSYAIAFVEIWRRACLGTNKPSRHLSVVHHVRHLAFVHYVDRLAIDCGGASSSALATRAAISGPTALIGGGSSIGSSLPTLRAPRVHLARSPRVNLARSPRVNLARSPSAQRRGMANSGSVTVNNGQ